MDFKIKRGLQKIVTEKQAQLDAGNLAFAVKREAQKNLNDAMEKLDAAIDANPEAAGNNEQLAKLIAGDYNDLDPEAFIQVIKDVCESLNGAVEPVKTPAANYLRVNNGRISGVMESALREVMGKLWSTDMLLA